MTFSIFVALLTEVMVDVLGSWVERRQGIRTEYWWRAISVSNLLSMSGFMCSAIFFNYWVIVNTLADPIELIMQAASVNATEEGDGEYASCCLMDHDTSCCLWTGGG